MLFVQTMFSFYRMCRADILIQIWEYPFTLENTNWRQQLIKSKHLKWWFRPWLTDWLMRFSAKAFKPVYTEGRRPPEHLTILTLTHIFQKKKHFNHYFLVSHLVMVSSFCAVQVELLLCMWTNLRKTCCVKLQGGQFSDSDSYNSTSLNLTQLAPATFAQFLL